MIIEYESVPKAIGIGPIKTIPPPFISPLLSLDVKLKIPPIIIAIMPKKINRNPIAIR